jgi:hypothetical protein
MTRWKLDLVRAWCVTETNDSSNNTFAEKVTQQDGGARKQYINTS